MGAENPREEEAANNANGVSGQAVERPTRMSPYVEMHSDGAVQYPIALMRPNEYGHYILADYYTRLAADFAAMRARAERAEGNHRKANDFIRKIDGVIEEIGAPIVSCVNTYEDIKASMLALKTSAESAEARVRELEAQLAKLR